jgi:uncharacterized protein (TIGR03118 family)
MKNIALKTRNLIAGTANIAENTDSNLLIPDSIVVTGNTFYVANTFTNVVTQYNQKGQNINTITVPLTLDNDQITYITKNTSHGGFVIPGYGPSVVIISTVYGEIFAANDATGATAIQVVTGGETCCDCTDIPYYTSLVMANDYLYAVDYTNAKIDVYDANWNLVSGCIAPTTYLFQDPSMPQYFVPFNITFMNGFLYVSYVSEAIHYNNIPGNGYIDIYDTNGNFIKRFASAGLLNFPSALMKAPHWLGLDHGSILVGNSGDGVVRIYSKYGEYNGSFVDEAGNLIHLGNTTVTGFGMAEFKGRLLYTTYYFPNGGFVPPSDGIIGEFY